MINAYQIVDFNNPLSVKYSEHSIESFKRVSDIINIVPIQCITPSTLPNITIDDKYNRTATEKAVLFSHYHLIKQIANGTQIIIMEHDAYLWPDRVDNFRDSITKIDQLDMWNCGVAIECYSMSVEAAQEFCKIIENEIEKHHPGPMWLIHLAADRACSHHGGQAMWPLKGNTNKSCTSTSVTSALNGKGLITDAPVTQHVIESEGVTIKKSNNWKYNKIDNKNLYFT